jgi:Predicted dithiol-disulfide isomerase involved in polyketide biosynthesis
LPKPPLVQPNGVRNFRHSDYSLGSLTTVTVFHDFICPWCWVGFFQARRLTEEFGLTFEWRGAELLPPGMKLPPGPPPKPAAPDAPPPKSRFDIFLEKEGVPLTSPGPKFVRSHSALLAAEYVWMEHGPEVFDRFNEAVYRGHWEKHENIGDVKVLMAMAESAGADPVALRLSVLREQYADHIVPFDDEAYARGIRHVPTFIFGAEERLAEAEYPALANAADRFLFRREKFLEVK